MEPSRPHKQSMAELKLRRLTEHNHRLREDLARPRIRVSEASVRWVTVVFISALRLVSIVYHYYRAGFVVRGAPVQEADESA